MKGKGSHEKTLFFEESKGERIVRELELRLVPLGNRILRVLIGRDVTTRINAEQELQRMNEHLEILVQERTESIEKQMRILKETQEQLIMSEKMALLGTLVAGVAHEINTPLGVGITASSFLVSESQKMLKHVQEDSLTHHLFVEFLDDLNQSALLIQSNLERAGELIQSFKQVAVDQSSELRRTINLRHYLSEVIQSLYPQWKKHTVTLEGSLEENLYTYPGDWSQILTNLIVNSVRHGFKDIPKGGMILIRIYAENGMIVLDYRDNGCGMTKEQSSHVFEPFFTTARGRGGTGLGMNIVYNLVTLKMKGSILCLPMEVPGAAFHIRVPISQENAESH
jgi:signal transduction histidine kinase